MQRVERREPEAIGALEQMKKLSHELRRLRSRMLLMPGVGKNQIVRADEPQASVRLPLVNHDLGTRRVQYVVEHKGQVREVESHGAVVGSADAAEQEVMEEFVTQEIAGGRPLPGTYPPNAETMARYRRWRDERDKKPT